MINSTLGGLIKDYRLQKGLSQFDIAFALGWKETSRLSRIEQGRTERPPRELLDKIISAIGLKEEEKNTLLLTGSYLPTEEEILKVKKETESILKEWPYPAVIIDFSWRVIDGNDKLYELFKLPSSVSKNIYRSQVRVFDVIFEYLLKNDQGKLSEMNQDNPMLIALREVIAQFKYEQRYRTKEKWFVEHIRKLMDKELFRTLWVDAQSIDVLKLVLGKHLKRQFLHPKDKNKLLSFYIFYVPVLKDPRFEVCLKVPADMETYNAYH